MLNAPILIPISTLYRIDSIAFIVLFALLSISSEEGVDSEIGVGSGVGLGLGLGVGVGSGLGTTVAIISGVDVGSVSDISFATLASTVASMLTSA